MPKYTVTIPADHSGTARSIEINAATPWLALEKTQKRYGWLTAELFDRGRSLGTFEHLPLRSTGVWRLLPRSPLVVES